MSVANVVAVRLINNNPADATFAALVGAAAYPYNTPILHNQTKIFKLSDVQGLQNGNVFTGRVILPSSGTTNTDGTQLTYVSSASLRAIYAVSGVANAPIITFQGTEANT